MSWPCRWRGQKKLGRVKIVVRGSSSPDGRWRSMLKSSVTVFGLIRLIRPSGWTSVLGIQELLGWRAEVVE